MLVRILIAIGLVSLLLSCTPVPDTEGGKLIGLWETVSGETNDGELVDPASKGEMEFLSNGEVRFTLVDPVNGIDSPIQIRGKYKITSANVVTYTMDGKTYERQAFKVIGDMLYLEHLDYETKSTLTRIQVSDYSGDAPVVSWPEIGS